MCIACGCGQPNAAHTHPGHHHHDHSGDHGAHHHHDHDHSEDHDHSHDHDHGAGDGASRTIRIEQDILAKNDAYARANRDWLRSKGVFALNLVSSPGAGKTTLLCATIAALNARSVAVIEGDQQTSLDADRIRATGAAAVQINTGKGCHLDAHGVGHAMVHFQFVEGGLLLIENVGNLVCPAAFDLGEAHKVVVLSVTEGEDKPLKYPDMFRASSVMVLNKIDLLPHVQFDVDKAIEYARRVRPDIRVLSLSATTGEGMGAWLDFLRSGMESAKPSA
ncbi:hydrogenase nickel incorporation protein HypB [Candidatus Symbiobacter mobilis]|uniref:Hydrogenase maturation factor HypB n=1 Tax=Candidatus Symbiobacter mobilis CR TaxID=946483 RepID=U5N5H4_9BURK|nr:hydrogenase nickel incorporation protein HypB [Candidatus Symbiobacter mobilis]AGX86766.1 hydrogenase nickel incorporation protein HypB [Candidatus Symbiobacter mobilis CR]